MKRLVGKVDICGLTFAVYLADEKGCPALKDCYGLCYPEHQEIFISSALGKAARRLYLTHEMLHGIYCLAGVHDVIAGATREGLEESFVRLLTPHVRTAERSADRVRL